MARGVFEAVSPGERSMIADLYIPILESGPGDAGRYHVAMPGCWRCAEDVPEATLAFEAFLLPRTAAKGGPVLLLLCPSCGQTNAVERNGAGEVLLSPPSVRDHRPPDLRGAAAAAARAWEAAHRDARRDFLLRRRPEVGALPPADAEEPALSPADAVPPPPGEPPPAAATGEVREIIEAYEILGLPLTASAEDIRRQYRRLARTCHPDRVADLDPEIRALAEKKFRRLRSAYERLSNESPGAAR